MLFQDALDKAQPVEGTEAYIAMVTDMLKAFETVTLFQVWTWGEYFGFPRKMLKVICKYFAMTRRIIYE
eukprot:9261930-Lingulodinium_polyedra.AAC.1